MTTTDEIITFSEPTWSQHRIEVMVFYNSRYSGYMHIRREDAPFERREMEYHWLYHHDPEYGRFPFGEPFERPFLMKCWMKHRIINLDEYKAIPNLPDTGLFGVERRRQSLIRAGIPIDRNIPLDELGMLGI